MRGDSNKAPQMKPVTTAKAQRTCASRPKAMVVWTAGEKALSDQPRNPPWTVWLEAPLPSPIRGGLRSIDGKYNPLKVRDVPAW